MIAKSNYSIFGISMERRSARRRLVVLAYVALATVCGLVIAFIRQYPYLYSNAAWVTSLFLTAVFGWQGRGGLLKPFANKPPRQEAAVVTAIELQLSPRTLLARDDESWRNDERELARRDLAHYRAYQPVTFAVILLVVLSAAANRPWTWLSSTVLAQVNFGVALVTMVMAVTLPAAIILWTEPDIESN